MSDFPKGLFRKIIDRSNKKVQFRNAIAPHLGKGMLGPTIFIFVAAFVAEFYRKEHNSSVLFFIVIPIWLLWGSIAFLKNMSSLSRNLHCCKCGRSIERTIELEKMGESDLCCNQCKSINL